MEKLDRSEIFNGRYKHWLCHRGHLMGVVGHVRDTLNINGKTLRYNATRLFLFREAIDISAEVPVEIDVAGFGDGRILSIVWRCSICGCIREWYAEKGVVEFVASTYLAE